MAERKRADVLKTKSYELIKDMWGVSEGHTVPKLRVVDEGWVIWEKKVTPFFETPKKFSVDFNIPKPFFEKRVERAERKAYRIAARENKKKE